MTGDPRTVILLLVTLGLSASGVGNRKTQEEPEAQRKLLTLAKAAVRAEVLHKALPHPDGTTQVRAVFVTIEIGGKVLGCRGTLHAKGGSLEEAVIDAARNAAVYDPRHKPLTAKQLGDFQVTVTLVDRLEPIQSVGGLQPDQGLVLTSGSRVGVVLPWEGKEAAVRLRWAYQKAGVPEGSAVKLERMVATRFKG